MLNGLGDTSYVITQYFLQLIGRSISSFRLYDIISQLRSTDNQGPYFTNRDWLILGRDKVITYIIYMICDFDTHVFNGTVTKPPL